MAKEKKATAAPGDTQTESAPAVEEVVTVSSGMGHGTRDAGAPEDVAIRDSWLINPRDIITAIPTAENEWQIITSKAAYSLTGPEAAQLGISGDKIIVRTGERNYELTREEATALGAQL